MCSSYGGLKFQYKNTSISENGFLLLVSSDRSEKKLSLFPPGVLSMNHPSSEPLAGVLSGAEPAVEAVGGAEPLVSLCSLSGALATESGFPFRYKESREEFMWFANWEKHDVSISYSKVLMKVWWPILTCFLLCASNNFSHNSYSQKNRRLQWDDSNTNIYYPKRCVPLPLQVNVPIHNGQLNKTK